MSKTYRSQLHLSAVVGTEWHLCRLGKDFLDAIPREPS
jgi:hypothetical protein